MPSLRHIEHFPTFLHRTWSGVIFLYIWLIKCVCGIMRFPLSVSLSSLLVSNKDNESPTAILRKKERWQTQSKVIPYFPSLLFFFFLPRHDMKKETCFYEITSFTPNGHLLGGFFFSLVVSLTSDLPHGSAGSLLVSRGLQVKPPFHHPSGRSRAKSHAQELAKIGLLPFVSHNAAFFSSWSAKKTFCALLHLYLSFASVLVFLFFSTWWVLFGCEAPF